MEKQYVYRKHVRKMQKILPIILCSFIALYFLFIAIVFSIVDFNNEAKFLFLFIGFFIAVVMGLEAVFIWIFLGRFVKVKVTLTDDYIIYRNAKGETRIPIDQIQRLEFPSIKYTGGWMKIIYPGGNVRLTVVLERIGDFLKELKTIIDSKGKEDTYDRKAVFSFYKTAEFSDQSWDRIYEIFVKLILFTLVNFIVGIVFKSFISDQMIGILLIAVSCGLPALIYSISEFIIATRIAKQSSEERFEVPQRNKEFENKIYKTAFSIYSVVYFSVAVILLILL